MIFKGVIEQVGLMKTCSPHIQTKRYGFISRQLTWLLIAGFSGSLHAEISLVDQINSIADGPSLCLTTQAVYNQVPTKIIGAYVDTSSNRVKCRSVLDAVQALSNAGPAAKDAIPILLQKYPIVVHVEVLNNLSYTAEVGTFEDWVLTKTMSVKNKLDLNPPFDAYNLVDPCADFIEATQEHEIFSPMYRGSVVQNAIVTIRVYYVMYVGACALSRITGLNLGTDQNQWLDYFSSAEKLSRMENTPPPIALTPPPVHYPTPTVQNTPTIVSYAELLQRMPMGAKSEIRLYGGSVIIGQLSLIEERGVQVEVAGIGNVAIKREVILQISLLSYQ
jgi:hypothetical protein